MYGGAACVGSSFYQDYQVIHQCLKILLIQCWVITVDFIDSWLASVRGAHHRSQNTAAIQLFAIIMEVQQGVKTGTNKYK